MYDQPDDDEQPNTPTQVAEGGTPVTQQEITTWEELNALPVGSIVIDPFDAKEDAPVICCKTAWGDWQLLGGDPERRWSPQSIVECAQGTLRVIHTPKGTQ